MKGPDINRADPSGESLFVRPPTVEGMREAPTEAEWNVALGTPPSGPAPAVSGPPEIAGVIDFALLQTIFENFLEVVGLPLAVIDLKGRVLASSRWQRLCMDFHRVAEGTLARCLESDISLSSDMAEGKEYALYRCRNGLVDCATPLMVEGVHVANLFVGQFLLAPPDLDYFRRQQEEFGFDADSYFKALSEIPIVAEERLPAILKLVGGLAQQIARQSFAEKRALAAQAAVETQVQERTRELAETSARLRKIADRVPGVVFQFMRRADGSYCIPYASDRVVWLFGFPPEAVHDDAGPVFATTHPEDLDGLRAAIESSAHHLSTWRHEFRVLRADGATRWLSGEAVPEREADGSVLWHGFISDVTERKRTQRLLESRLRLAGLPASCSLRDLLVATLDEACALTGAETGLFHFLLPDQRTMVLQACSTRTIAEICSGAPESIHCDVEEAGIWAECVRQRRSIIHNGDAALPPSARPCEGRAPVNRLISVPIFRDGVIRAIIGLGDKPADFDESDLVSLGTLADMAWDLAERKRAECELAERTRALASSNNDLEQFAYVASHDLRQPLRMVNSYLALIERRYADKLDDDGREFIGFARGGALQMDRLILDLLEYSRVGRHGQNAEEIDLADAAGLACRQLQPLIEETGARVDVRGPDEARIVASRLELIRLFQNIIGNSLKYRSPDRPPRVDVAWRREDDHWLVSVADNGIGIEPQYGEDIFKIFRRLHTSEQYEGTGIGLAICKKIVKHLGGRIWVESEPGRGSTFLFTIPL